MALTARLATFAGDARMRRQFLNPVFRANAPIRSRQVSAHEVPKQGMMQR